MNDTLERKKQIVISVTKLEEDEHLIKESLSGVTNVECYFYKDPLSLLSSSEYKQADVFIVSVELNNYDGRNLYLEQKNRLRHDWSDA